MATELICLYCNSPKVMGKRKCICIVTDYCGCPKPADCWGADGWHWKPTPKWPHGRLRSGPAWGVAYERCPAYDAAAKRKEEEARMSD